MKFKVLLNIIFYRKSLEMKVLVSQETDYFVIVLRNDGLKKFNNKTNQCINKKANLHRKKNLRARFSKSNFLIEDMKAIGFFVKEHAALLIVS